MKLHKIIATYFLVAVVALVGIFVLPTNAQAATEGYYTYEVYDGEATITDCSTSISGDVTVPSTLGGYPVTSIGNWVFYNCFNLTSITIPSGVSSIGDRAFAGCSRLTSITILSGVSSIGDWAFSDCTSLTSITIPDSVTSIGSSAFSDCSSLTSITIPDGVTSIGSSAFQGCTRLASIAIPDSVTSIGYDAFYWCRSLTSITIPDSVTSIGFDAFSGCSSLVSITIPDSVTSIGNRAFNYCDRLENIYYAADSTKWAQISMGSNNEDLTGATIHYNHIHNYSLLPSTVVAATCTANGYTEYTCIYGETHRAEYISALGHDYSRILSVVQPTCTAAGYTNAVCVRCDQEGQIAGIPALGHAMVILPAVTPRCTQDGLTAGSCCERCPDAGVAQKVIPAIGHNYVNGMCLNCDPDCDDNGLVTDGDAVYLLRYTLFPEYFPLRGNGDVNADGQITDADAVYLLRYTLFPEYFPLYSKKKEV